MLSHTGDQSHMQESIEPTVNTEKVNILSHAEARRLQETAREKYRKAFEELKDK